MKKTFRIHYECTAELTADQIWPDGDGPSEPTTADVCALIKRLHLDGPRLIQDWELEGALSVDGGDV